MGLLVDGVGWWDLAQRTDEPDNRLVAPGGESFDSAAEVLCLLAEQRDRGLVKGRGAEGRPRLLLERSPEVLQKCRQAARAEAMGKRPQLPCAN